MLTKLVRTQQAILYMYCKDYCYYLKRSIAVYKKELFASPSKKNRYSTGCPQDLQGRQNKFAGLVFLF